MINMQNEREVVQYCVPALIKHTTNQWERPPSFHAAVLTINNCVNKNGKYNNYHMKHCS